MNGAAVRRRGITTLAVVVAVAVLVAVLVGGIWIWDSHRATGGPPAGVSAAQWSQLARQEAIWRAHAPRSYRFTFSQGGMAGGQDHVITVLDGKPAGVSPTWVTGVAASPAEEPRSMDDVFAVARSALTHRVPNFGYGRPGPIVPGQVQFDATRGFPRSGGYDDTGHGVSDDFWSFEVTGFTVLPG